VLHTTLISSSLITLAVLGEAGPQQNKKSHMCNVQACPTVVSSLQASMW